MAGELEPSQMFAITHGHAQEPYESQTDELSGKNCRQKMPLKGFKKTSHASIKDAKNCVWNMVWRQFVERSEMILGCNYENITKKRKMQVCIYCVVKNIHCRSIIEISQLTKWLQYILTTLYQISLNFTGYPTDYHLQTHLINFPSQEYPILCLLQRKHNWLPALHYNFVMNYNI